MNFLRVKETCIYVKDLKRTIEFYRDKLGLELISTVEGRHVFFRAGESVLLCFIPESTKEEKVLPPHFASGQIHFAFEVKPEQYQETKNQITEQGIKIEHEHEWPTGLLSFYFRDPDMNLVEVIEEGLWDKK